MARPKNPKLREFILQQISGHATDIATFTAERMGVTRASVNGYLRRLLEEDLIEATGKTKGRRYRLKILEMFQIPIALQADTQEDVIVREQFIPLFAKLKPNISAICEYGLLEMLNNAIEHSEGKGVYINYERDYVQATIWLYDNGVGIFDKITRECKLADKREALLELSKGKLTTDRTKHTGEGIFFTSRMFDRFEIVSGGLGYIRRRKDDDDRLADVEPRENDVVGTRIMMRISNSASQTTQETFAKYLDDNDRFSKTIIPLKLAKYEGEHLVSRSQARRLMARVEKFSEVVLDFEGIEDVGQPFADEIYRVWSSSHPAVHLQWSNTSPEVLRMINHALSNVTDGPSSHGGISPSEAADRKA